MPRLSALCAVTALACALFAAVCAVRAQTSRVDACSEELYLDRTAPGADRTLHWTYSFATDEERCISVHVGQTVTWQGNLGDHPLEANEGDRPNPIDAHVAGVVRFDRPGTYGYRCNYHLEMRGAIHVLPLPSAVPWAGPLGTAALAALLLGLVALTLHATGLADDERAASAHAHVMRREDDCRARASNSSRP